MKKIIFIFCICFSCCANYYSQTYKTLSQVTRVLFVFDASNSMQSKHGSVTRIEGAKQLFYKFIDSLSKQKNIEFALRMYGNTVKYPPGDCKDSRLIVPFGKNNIAVIKAKVAEAKPTGITPIEHSLTQSANDFPDAKAVNMIILITDGIEECGGDPCSARQKLMEKGIVFKPFIIGIGLKPEQIKTFACVGNYYDFDNANIVTDIASIISKQKLNKTSAQVNLLDTKSLPTESNVNMTFYNTQTGNYMYNYIHTLNFKDNPDTLYIDDYPTYKVVAHTIPTTESKEIKLSQGKHTVIAIDAPQGYLILKRTNEIYNFNERIKCIVRLSTGNLQTLNVQQINVTEKYITGSYELEALTLPRTYFKNIIITQSQTKIIELASAGLLTIKALDNGDGSIYKDTKPLEWVCNLNSTTSQTYYMQPGNYRVEWRAKTLKGSIYTIEKKFTIKSDYETKVLLYQ